MTMSLAVKSVWQTGISFLFLLLTMISVHAANWYLDNKAKGAKDGTSWTNAWTSFHEIPRSLMAGDTVYVSGGPDGQTYAGEQFPHVRGGAQGNPITFRVGRDVGHNGMVTIDRGTLAPNYQWIFAGPAVPIKWITIDGNYNGVSHLRLTNWGTVCLLDGGATGIVLRYITSVANGQWRAYGCDNMEYDHCLIGPQMGIDRCIVGIGSGVANQKANQIHDCTIFAYYQHDHNAKNGNGDDFVANISSCWVYRNNIIGVYAGPGNSYTYTQHQDGIQSGGNYCLIDSNYFENCANYCIYGDMIGGGSNWTVINNVINYSDRILSQEQPTAGIAIGSNSEPGNLENIIIANNTVYGGGIGIALGTYDRGNKLVNCQVVNNLCVGQAGQPIYDLPGQGANLITLCNKPDSGCVPPNTQRPRNNSRAAFVNPAGSYPDARYGSNHFQLARTDMGATANGTNALAKLFDHDALGNSRPSGAWALGAYEPTSDGAMTPATRRR